MPPDSESGPPPADPETGSGPGSLVPGPPGPGSAAPAGRSWPRRLLNRFEVDRAVFYAVLVRGWQLAAGPVSLLLIAAFFTPELQGWYYTFSSLLALQAFVELGFQLVLINLASHEWSQLSLDDAGAVQGEPAALSRLASLMRLSVRWYAGAATVFAAVVLPAGIAFFLYQPGAEQLSWKGPWTILALLTSLNLAVQPLIALLDGCNQMATVNRYRLLQAVASNVAVWTCIPLGGGLWTSVAVAAARLGGDLLLTCVRYRRFFLKLWQTELTHTISWGGEVWPLQWRLAVQGALGFLMHWLFSPVLFHYHGASSAGQMGMSLTVVLTLQLASLAWVETRSPRFGMLVARRDFRELDRVFLRVSGLSLVVYVAGAAILLAVVLLMNSSSVPVLQQLSRRLLPPLPLAIFLCGALFDQLVRYQKFYLRAFQRDPQTAVNVAGQLLTGLLIWQLGSRYGALGAVSGWCAVQACWFAPTGTWIWYRCRREWRLERESQTA